MPSSPGQGSIIGRLPFIQGLLRHPYAEEPSSGTRRDLSSRNIDPVTQEPLTLSPAGLVESASHPYIRPPEPMVSISPGRMWLDLPEAISDTQVADEEVSRLFDDIFNPIVDLPTGTGSPLWTDAQESFAPWIEAEPWFTAETWMAHAPMASDLS